MLSIEEKENQNESSEEKNRQWKKENLEVPEAESPRSKTRPDLIIDKEKVSKVTSHGNVSCLPKRLCYLTSITFCWRRITTMLKTIFLRSM